MQVHAPLCFGVINPFCLALDSSRLSLSLLPHALTVQEELAYNALIQDIPG